MAVTVVVVTRNRRAQLLRSLDRLTSLPGRPWVIVVDNGSSDGSPAAVAQRFPAVEVVAAGANLGAAGRTIGARRASTGYVAFADDDSWWAPEALDRAEAILDADPRVAVLAGRILVGPGERLDPLCEQLAVGGGPELPGLPGPSIKGFAACGAVLRRDAFLSVGGFHARFGIGGEEELLCIDLAARGWAACYADDVVAYHHPEPAGREDRSARQVRNRLWTAWLRRPLADCVRSTAAALADPVGRRGLRAAVAGLPWVIAERQPLGSTSR